MIKRIVETRDGVNFIYEDGILDSKTPSGGTGVAMHYFPSGAIKSEVPIKNYETHGVVRGWHENGQLALEHTIIDRQIIGISRTWTPEGFLEAEAEHITPHAIYSKSPSRNGRLRQIFLWVGKPLSKKRWLQKIADQDLLTPEIMRRFGDPEQPDEKSDVAVE